VARRAPPTRTDDPSRGSALAAGLVYVSDARRGLTRHRRGHGFAYRDTRGRLIREPATLERLRALAIPPAWSSVWICADPRGHLQATGRDARGRKQYRYHRRWREVRDATKYDRLLAFARALPRIRRRVARDLRSRRLTRDRVLAVVTRLLELTLIRVGSEEYARHNGSYGLTTLRDAHVRISGADLRFRFRGKGGKRHTILVSDRRLARAVARCQELPGQELFQYVDGAGRQRSITSADVNAYLHEAAGAPFTAKDFRTWNGTVLAAAALGELAATDGAVPTKTSVVRAIEAVAERLGNTVAICRRAYVHPAVIDAYLDGTLRGALARRPRGLARELRGLDPEETSVAGLLHDALARAARRAS
jgi:DNA topoisomerase-1